MDPFHLGDPGREVGEGAKPALAGYREETDNSFALGKLIGSQGGFPGASLNNCGQDAKRQEIRFSKQPGISLLDIRLELGYGSSETKKGRRHPLAHRG